MANIIREALSADGMSLHLFCGGMSKVGFGIAGTFVGTVSFFASQDGVNFLPAFVTPFASGTAVSTTTATGNWELTVRNALVVKVVFTRTSGTVIATLATSIDSSYQNAFLASTSVYATSSHAAGATNVLTIAAQTNRAWRLRTLVITWSAAPAAAVLCTVTDGASTVIWESYVPTAGGQVVLPADANVPGLTGGGVVNTPGNSLVVTVADPGGSVVSKINAELSAA